jgi:hypothetical protein
MAIECGIRMVAGLCHIPFPRRGDTKQVLKRTKHLPLNQGEDEDNSPCILAYQRMERVITALNNMDLALQAAELEPDGIRKLFNQLWSSDQL